MLLFILYPGVVEKLRRARSLTRVVLQAAVDEALALFGDVVGDFGPLQIRQFLLQGHVCVALAVEAVAPGVLPRDHLDDEAAERPYV